MFWFLTDVPGIQVSVDPDLQLSLPSHPPSTQSPPQNSLVWPPLHYDGHAQDPAWIDNPLSSPGVQSSSDVLDIETNTFYLHSFSGPVSDCTMLADWNDPHHWGYDSDETVPPDSELENDVDVVGTLISEENLASDVDLFATSGDEDGLDSDIDLFLD